MSISRENDDKDIIIRLRPNAYPFECPDCGSRIHTLCQPNSFPGALEDRGRTRARTQTNRHGCGVSEDGCLQWIPRARDRGRNVLLIVRDLQSQRKA